MLSVPLGLQAKRLRGGLASFPTFQELEPSLAEARIPETSTESHVNMADGERGVRFVRGSAHLKLTKPSLKGLNEVINIVYPEAQLKPDDMPRHSILQHGRKRFDIMLTLLMRTIMTWYMIHDPQASVYNFIDGSPTCGFEALIAAECFFRRWQAGIACYLSHF